MKINRRHQEQRIECDIAIKIFYRDRTYQGKLTNLSRSGGRFIQVDFHFKSGYYVEIELVLHKQTFRASCVIMSHHSQKNSFGFSFYLMSFNHAKILEKYISQINDYRTPIEEEIAKNILSLGVGGIKILSQIAILEELERLANKQTFEIFDLIGGVSSGGINASFLCMGIPAVEIKKIYLENFADMLSPNLSFWQGIFNRFNLGNKIKRAIGTSHPSCFREMKTNLLVLTRSFEDGIHYYYSKNTTPEYPITQALLSTTAIPVIFGPNQGEWMDGGVGSFANPSEAIARVVYQANTEQKVFYIDSGMDPIKRYNKNNANIFSQLSWAIEMFSYDHLLNATTRIEHCFPSMQYYPYLFTFSQFHDLLQTKDMKKIYEEASIEAKPIAQDICDKLYPIETSG
ncbi:MAG: patatin-like phospholipase family protein [Spirochaetota bacterium]